MDVSVIFQVFNKGGFVMYPLLACSVVTLGIGLERFAFFRSHHTNTPHFLSALKPAFQQRNWQEALEICRNTPGDIALILEESLVDTSVNPHYIHQFFETAAALAAARLRERLNILENIVTLSPLLGLLGTVFGMIESFSVMSVQTSQPPIIAGGVGEALVATGTGLSVAILAFILHSYFVNRLDKTITDMEEVFGCVLNIMVRSERS